MAAITKIRTTMLKQPRRDAIQRLAEQLRCIERGRPTRTAGKLVSTGLSILDDLLPDGGIQPGSIIEWLLPGPGSGAGTLNLLIAAHQMQGAGTLLVIDPQHTFYPPAAANLGIDLERMVVVRTGSLKDTLWTLEQALRCPGVAVVVCHLEHLDDHSFRRLQLAAETGGGLGLLLRPERFREQPSWAEVRLRIGGEFEIQSSKSKTRNLRLELLRCRGSSVNKTILLGLDDETGSVSFVSEPASAPYLSRARA